MIEKIQMQTKNKIEEEKKKKNWICIGSILMEAWTTKKKQEHLNSFSLYQISRKKITPKIKISFLTNKFFFFFFLFCFCLIFVFDFCFLRFRVYSSCLFKLYFLIEFSFLLLLHFLLGCHSWFCWLCCFVGEWKHWTVLCVFSNCE